MGWVWERLRSTNHWNVWKRKFLTLKGSELQIFEMPPVSIQQFFNAWIHCWATVPTSNQCSQHCAVPENVHIPSTEGIRISHGVWVSPRPKYLKKHIKLNWNFQRGAMGSWKTDLLCGGRMDISGSTHCQLTVLSFTQPKVDNYVSGV